jgi:hypothetical protein
MCTAACAQPACRMVLVVPVLRRLAAVPSVSATAHTRPYRCCADCLSAPLWPGSPWMFPWERRQLQGGELRWWEKMYWGVFVVGIALILFNRLEWEKAPDPVRPPVPHLPCMLAVAGSLVQLWQLVGTGRGAAARVVVLNARAGGVPNHTMPSIRCAACGSPQPPHKWLSLAVAAGNRGAAQAAGGAADGGSAHRAGGEEHPGALGHRRPVWRHVSPGAH